MLISKPMIAIAIIPVVACVATLAGAMTGSVMIVNEHLHPDKVLSSVHYYRPPYAEGVLVNESGHSYASATVEYTAYSKNGRKSGKWSRCFRNFRSRDKYHFVLVLGKHALDGKLVSRITLKE